MNTLKVAFPTKDLILLDSQFYGCKNFKIFTIENNKIVGTTLLTPPADTHGEVPEFLIKEKIDVCISGPIEEDTFKFLKENEVDVVYGVRGVMVDLIRIYLNGDLKSSGKFCTH